MKHDTGPYLPSHGPYLPGYFDEWKKRKISWKLSRDKIVDPRCLIWGTLFRRDAISHTKSEKPSLATVHRKKIAILQNRPIPAGSPLYTYGFSQMMPLVEDITKNKEINIFLKCLFVRNPLKSRYLPSG